MTTLQYDPDAPRSAEELELETTIRDLVEQLNDAREGSAAHRMITRQLQGLRRTELGELIIQEHEMRAELFLPSVPR